MFAVSTSGTDSRGAVACRAFFSGTVDNPIYVDRIFPDRRTRGRLPVVMLHGACHTGLRYLSTPDGRRGWADHFAGVGHEVYVVDWPGHGRSPPSPHLATLSTQEIAESVLTLVATVGPVILLVHSASGPMAWWICERAPDLVSAVVAVAPGAPANILRHLPADPVAIASFSHDVEMGCPVMHSEERPIIVDDNFVRSFWANAPHFPHSAYDQYKLSIVPESARLFNERFNIGGRGLRIQDPSALADTPILIATGEHDPRHSRSLDEATSRYLGAQFIWLADEGISGNGHMPMIEKNSDKVADLLLRWLTSRGL